MGVQDPIFPREIFLRMMKLESSNWSKRVSLGETSLGFGLRRAAHVNEYGRFDAVTTLLVTAVTNLARIEMKVAAELVNTKWEDVLQGIGAAEREKEREKESAPITAQTVFAIGKAAGKKPEAAIGKLQAAVDQVDGPDVPLIIVPLQLVIQTAYERAKAVKVDFPTRLTPEPGSKAWDKWIEQVREYRDAAGLKDKARVRAKA